MQGKLYNQPVACWYMGPNISFENLLECYEIKTYFLLFEKK